MKKYNNESKSCYSNFYKFDNITDINTLKKYDSYAANDISRLLDIIEELKEYRKDLFQYSQELTQKSYFLQLSLFREVHYYENKKYYFVTLEKVYDNGKMLLLSEKHPGTKRHVAIKRFEQLKKQYPGIKTIINIKKSKWEK